MATTQIEIVSYNRNWPEEFILLASPLREKLAELALRIDHIGSTSVPNLQAKDRIDMQVTVASSNEFDLVRSKLEEIGYKQHERIFSDHVPPGGPEAPEQWEKRLFNPPEQQRATNLHVRIEGRANQRYAILFRDYLRVEPNIAEAYALVKQQLANYHSDNIEAYCDIKDPVCDIILLNAQKWAKNTSWLPGPSDA